MLPHFAYVSFNLCGEGVFIMKLNALMVRYIVNDVDAAVAFYSQQLGFQVTAQSGPHFAILSRENMQLVLSPPLSPTRSGQKIGATMLATVFTAPERDGLKQ